MLIDLTSIILIGTNGLTVAELFKANLYILIIYKYNLFIYILIYKNLFKIFKK